MPRKAHPKLTNATNAAKNSDRNDRSAKHSPTRRRVEKFMAENCESYTTKELSSAMGIRVETVGQTMREMRNAGILCHAGRNHETHKHRWAHRDHVHLHTKNAGDEGQSQENSAKTNRNITPPRLHTNAAMPNGEPSYWARMMAWGR